MNKREKKGNSPCFLSNGRSARVVSLQVSFLWKGQAYLRKRGRLFRAVIARMANLGMVIAAF